LTYDPPSSSLSSPLPLPLLPPPSPSPPSPSPPHKYFELGALIIAGVCCFITIIIFGYFLARGEEGERDETAHVSCSMLLALNSSCRTCVSSGITEFISFSFFLFSFFLFSFFFSYFFFSLFSHFFLFCRKKEKEKEKKKKRKRKREKRKEKREKKKVFYII
jgi:hypothetical protein